MIWICIGLGVSILLNLVAVLYVRSFLSIYKEYLNNIQHFKYNLEGYAVHLEAVYNMDTFYGEPILENLLQHTRTIDASTREFIEIFSTPPEDDTISTPEEWSRLVGSDEVGDEFVEYEETSA